MDVPGPSHRRRLIDSIAPTGPNWIVEIHEVPFNMSYLRNEEVWDRTPKTNDRDPSSKDKNNIDLIDLLLFQAVDDKPDQLFDYMVKQCMTAQYLIVGLAKHLSGKSTETVFKRIFAGKDLTDHFVECFYAIFFPVYLKRAYSWFCIDLLIRAHTSWPVPFKRLFQILIQNVQISKRVLQDFVVNLKQKHRDSMMKAILEVELTRDQFVHHLTTINFLFLNSDMSTEVCQFVFKILEANATDCYDNRDYGRLLLSLLQNLGQTQVSQRIVKKLIDKHGSEYKAPCMIAFDDIISNIVALQYQQQEFARIYVERPEDHGFRMP